jgi:hypothetical protein
MDDQEITAFGLFVGFKQMLDESIAFRDPVAKKPTRHFGSVISYSKACHASLPFESCQASDI